MNKSERKQLEIIIHDLESMQSVEQEKYDNAPEGLEYSERYERIQEIADSLQEAIDILQEIVEV